MDAADLLEERLKEERGVWLDGDDVVFGVLRAVGWAEGLAIFSFGEGQPQLQGVVPARQN